MFGDLNFRLLPDMIDHDRVVNEIRLQNYPDLLKKDEFLAMRDKDPLLR